ncbi:ribosome recycling factor family protein [Shewanella maritima]|uniref:ribosome recycling factor family protein n=1 Tax=Shewanella maritima TaxID=2520507 RepID=UPI003736EE46
MSKVISIHLPSLLRKMGQHNLGVLKQAAILHHCHITRVRRSRNWQIEGDVHCLAELASYLSVEQLNLTEQSALDSFTKKLSAGLTPYADYLIPLSTRLVQLIRQNPAITLNELMSLTQCSESQARTARFEADDW